MEDPIEVAAPDDSGSVTMLRYEYQVHVAVQSVLEMLADGSVRHVTCEHIEDVVVARSGEPGLDGALFWDFQQVKTREKTDPWTLTDVIAKGALKSLWRTHDAVRDKGLAYRLTIGVEGYLDPADDLVVALSRGEGASREQCLKRVAKHVKADSGPATEYLNLVRVKQLPLRDIIEARSIAVLGELGPNLTMSEITALYTQLLDRTREAMQGRLGPRWMEQLNLVDPPERLRRKRVDAASVADIRQRLVRPDRVLLGDVSRQRGSAWLPYGRRGGNVMDDVRGLLAEYGQWRRDDTASVRERSEQLADMVMVLLRRSLPYEAVQPVDLDGDPGVSFDFEGRDYLVSFAQDPDDAGQSLGRAVTRTVRAAGLTGQRGDTRWPLLYWSDGQERADVQLVDSVKAFGVVLDLTHLDAALTGLSPLAELIRDVFRQHRPYVPLASLLTTGGPAVDSWGMTPAARLTSPVRVETQTWEGAGVEVLLLGQAQDAQPSGLAWWTGTRC
ncbi:dsDNA nuclease domain-containing protein [Streptomyces sp. NPDC002870]|uniref:dsDNA nuclease domain-containing protein n=1 Tax=Streptomyces sp. NPDC002870 TaxID=3364666 RepID=UPI003685AF12